MALLASRAQEAGHDYRTCPDPDCPRFPCRIWREALADGYAQGFMDGEAAGYSAGYAAGAAAAGGGS